MSTKIVLPCSLVLAVLGVGVVRGQDYRPMPRDPLPPPGLELDPTNLPAPVAQGGMPGLPGAGPGALLDIRGAGAYGFSMSSQYNSRPRAAEVVVDGERYALARQRETVEDLLKGESVDVKWTAP